MNGLHLPDRIRRYAVDRADRPALSFRDSSWTFAELDRETNRVATALTSLAAPGSRVGALLRMQPEGAAGFIGAAKAGMVFTPLNWRLPATEIADIAVDAELSVLIAHTDFRESADAVRAALPAVQVVWVDDAHSSDSSGGGTGDAGWASFVASGSEDDPGYGTDPDTAVLQLYTSGTTGRPKGVVSTHRNLHNDDAGLRVYRWKDDSVSLDAMPLFHIAGAGWLSSSLSAGAHVVLLDNFDAAEVLGLVETHGITHAFLVPSTVRMLLDVPTLEDHDLSSLEVVFYGSSPATAALLTEAITRLGCGFVQRYGMTETTGSVSALAVEDHDPSGPRAHLLSSAGRPMPGVEIDIRDVVTGAPLPTGDTGEIVCRSRNNVSGYWKRPTETAELFTADGFLRTGDAGHLDADGYLYVTDRLKDMIISGGENVYPIEVESALVEHPAVAEAAVVGIPDAVWGEAVTAAVRLVPGALAPSAGELVDFAASRLASYKKPRHVHFVDELPRNAGGKILKRTLREQLGGRLPEEPGPGTSHRSGAHA
ncbi:long-chain-fatty-acid--CoA ligase [Rhodococcus triatomae]|uniref:Acyl-CoA synthetase (AMP-forming)/AMP-acid ligase II n=1 Tax=Rhodococcus triatomae TaxID=300028 RepID=A0A1G8GEE0_9NOCA|nr:long-chain-fatty-acid--CoA ligase [Rhodococcus triatomae]QNG20406.1 long-chain-fatty-acid--CoA ligase [Rhodococcus triatomae]QNG23678.1 long-chain-fatty-acid--CoA ligase [Rhodococcus triatomae]SDH92657.1 Acyl-CoA synthetase (AMP-forming)/AMP-acid ligase II [Rhodococcus triatomae]